MDDMKKNYNQKHQGAAKDVTVGCSLWTDGLICAFEAKRSHKKHKPQDTTGLRKQGSQNGINDSLDDRFDNNVYAGIYWVPIGWSRITQLVETIRVNGCWETEYTEFESDDNEVTVADIAVPYRERPVGPTWWCHVEAGHPSVHSWLSNSKWLHPAISIALRDESKLISERMKHLLYEVPVRVAGGLLFELLGQSAGDPYIEEDDIPVVLRSWQAQNFLVTALHVKGSATNVNVLGVSEVQELLAAGGSNLPQTIHEVIALLACRLARWDDRLFRKYIFGAADEVELKFMNRRNQEDLHLFSIILNQEIRRLSSQVIRVKWSLHAREEIVFELLQHLRGNAAKKLLEGITKSTRQMIEEQEAVRGRLFTVQDVMQSTVRAWLQQLSSRGGKCAGRDKSLRVTHNLGVFGGCGLVLSIITGLFGINVDGIPGSENSPYAFLLFTCILVLLGIILIVMGLLYLGLKNPAMEEEVEVRKLELEELVKMFQQEAETHAQVRKSDSRTRTSSAQVSNMLHSGSDDSYLLMPSDHN
ncbi:magnesium transporter CorA-like family protein [Artemisia annua]|uniref:Magnesium transporter CorA-like family protein n=1 Tax=Artemisia annua TaxID=35608 RepID=A0A2U1Q7X3_ARTAN|nr:magnesium transporter CorA-like family protein [Artemisia annua]